MELRLSALHQLHLVSRLSTWLHWIGQRQLQDDGIQRILRLFYCSNLAYDLALLIKLHVALLQGLWGAMSAKVKEFGKINYRPGVGVTEALFGNFSVTRTFDSAKVDARYFQSRTHLPPVKYERDIIQVTSVFIILKNVKITKRWELAKKPTPLISAVSGGFEQQYGKLAPQLWNQISLIHGLRIK